MSGESSQDNGFELTWDPENRKRTQRPGAQAIHPGDNGEGGKFVSPDHFI